jgi:hypothetical protein
MRTTRATTRLVRRSAVLAAALALGATATAYADITGTVTNPAGVPLPGVSVRATGADGGFADFDTTDANGAYTIDTDFSTAPFTVTATYTDYCRDYGSTDLSASAPGLPATGTANLTLDPYLFCRTAFTPSSLPPATGNVWPERREVLAPPSGVAYLRVLAPSGASDFSLSLQDGTVVGSGTDASELALTAPAAPYSGPLNLTYTSSGARVTRAIGTLRSGPIPPPVNPPGPTDLAAIVDISGSMSANDPSFKRKDAVGLLVNLAGTGDRLVGIGFDDQLSTIFPRTTITGQATKNALIRAARKGIVNRGGTDYNVGIGAAYTALSADPFQPQVPKAAIFLTDGANGSTYDNSHLRFAFNDSGHAWPICVVQLGKGFAKDDVALLKRIAKETGGAYSATATDASLQSLYFQCRGKTTGATILLKKVNVFRVGQKRTYARKVKKRQRLATFFISWGAGKYRLQLTQPGGKVYSRTTGKKVRLVKSKSSAFFQVKTPKPGVWKLRVTRLKTGARTDRATTTVMVQPKR